MENSNWKYDKELHRLAENWGEGKKILSRNDVINAGGCGDIVRIYYGTEEIGERAFTDEKLEKIELPSSLVKIGDYAFCNCENLVRIEIPYSVKSIGKNAFAFCKNLIFVDVEKELLETIDIDSVFLGTPFLRILKENSNEN